MISKTDNTELMASLKKTLDELEPAVQAGDDDAIVKWAMGKALYKFMAAGHKLTDLEWFKGTSYYTGTSAEDIAA